MNIGKQLFCKVLLLIALLQFTTANAQTTRYVYTYSEFNSAISNSSSSVTDVIELMADIIVPSSVTNPSAASAFNISKSITIKGNGKTISVSQPAMSPWGTPNSSYSKYRVFRFTGSSVTVTLENMTIVGGNLESNRGPGGAIENFATLVMNNVHITRSRATSGTSFPSNAGNGGALFNDATGKVFATDCQFSFNTATYGGAIVNNGNMFFERCRVVNNRSDASGGGGGGIENHKNLYINNSTFRNNITTDQGAAIHNYTANSSSQAYVYVMNSTFSGNVSNSSKSGAAVSSAGTFSQFVNCVFAYNYARTSGSESNPTAFTLEDFSQSGSGSVSHILINCVHHSSSNNINTNSSSGNILYTGNASGNNDSIFSGGETSRIYDVNWNPIGTVSLYRPLEITTAKIQSACYSAIRIGSFLNKTANKGIITGFTFGNGTPSFGYYNNSTSSWVNVLGSAASTNTVSKDQALNTRNSTAPTRGNMEVEYPPIYSYQSQRSDSGYVTGANTCCVAYISGGTYTVRAYPNTGFEFSHWYDILGDSILSTSNPLTFTLNRHIVLKPFFKSTARYTVSYDGNDQTSGSAPSLQTFTSTGSVTISGAGSTLVRDEYYFNGWNTEPTGQGTDYSAGSTYSTTSNITLYAKWEPYIKYYPRAANASSLNSVSSWRPFPDESGTAPVNFGSGKIFILDNTTGTTSFTSGGDWSVDGALMIPTGKTLNLTASSTLTMSGDMTNEGTIIGGTSSLLKLDGTVKQYLGGSNQLANLEIDNSAGVQLILNPNGFSSFVWRAVISESLTLTNGNLSTVATSYSNFDLRLWLTSNSSRTAIINPIASGASITGNIGVQRYIPARRAFRLISSPVNTERTIMENLQLNNPTTGYGTHITGTTTSSNGFDATLTGNPSMYTYSNTSQTWSSIPNTNQTKLISGTPYRLMIRGDRTISLATNTPTPTNTTLQAAGTIVAGTVAVTNLNQTTDGFSLVGNPYMAPVNMQTILSNSTNLNQTYYYIWDPTMSTRGAYVTVDVSNNTSTTGSNANRFLQPWQACFVKTASNGSASLTFTEASKGTSLTSTWRMTPPLSTLNINLWQSDTFNILNSKPLDGMVVRFDPSFNSSYDQLDATKPTNLDENFALINQGKKVSIDSRNLPELTDTIPFEFTQIRDKNYTLEFEFTDALGQNVYLLDKKLGLHYPLESTGKTTYNFVVENASDLSEKDRFALIFNSASSSTAKINRNLFSIKSTDNSQSNVVLDFAGQLKGQGKAWVINAIGQVIMEKEFNTNSTSLEMDLSGQTVGVYYIKVVSGNHCQTTPWIIK
jgi:uncharacterized repeat protein (TIGR02543 family)